MGNGTIEGTVTTLLDILDRKWPLLPEGSDDNNEEDAYTLSSWGQQTLSNAFTEGNFSTNVNDPSNSNTDPELFTLTWLSDEWNSSLPMSTIDPDFGDVLTLYYGFAVAISVLAVIVFLIIIFLCCERLKKSRKRAQLAAPKPVEPAVVCSGVNARREVFHNLANQALQSEMPAAGLYNVSVTPRVEEYELRDFKSSDRPCKPFHKVANVHHGNKTPHPTRVYSSSRWTPDFNGNLVHVAIENSASGSNRRDVVTVSGAPTNRTFTSRSNTQKIFSRQPQRKLRLPKFNLAGEPITTSSEPSFVSGSQRRSPEVEVPQFKAKRGHESSLIVPANSPNCSSDDDNSESVFLPGGREKTTTVAPDSDFGASAGVSHYNVSSNTSLQHHPEESIASNSYVWDGYDPSFRRRPLSYIDGAYYPVLGEKQYWV